MHISKFFAGKIAWAKAAAVLLVGAAAVMLNPTTAQAQLDRQTTVGAVRLGAFIPVNSATRNTFGKYYFDGGLDYTIQQSGVSERDIVSVDYWQFSHSGNNIRTIPVTIGQQILGKTEGQGVRSYVGYGIGVYFVHIKQPGNPNFGGSDTKNGTAFGGYINAGLDLTSKFFIDARYHIVTPIKSVNTDGLMVTAGLRF